MTLRRPFDRSQIVGRALQKYRPATGVAENQGDPYYALPGVTEQFQIPADPGINYLGWRNPFKSTTYLAANLDTANPTIVLPGNLRRVYLLLQNLGPGNLWVNFGSDAVVNTCHVLITTQFYEQIGGGGFDYTRNKSVPQSFVTREYVSVIPDAVATSVAITEGIWTFTPEEAQ